MKKLLCLVLSCLLAVSSIPALALEIDYGSLTDQELQEIINNAREELEDRHNNTTESNAAHVPVTIEQSPDKYTWYMKDYVGKNVASFGYTSLGGGRMDAYGEGLLNLILFTNDGIYVDIDDEDVLKQYVVTGQSIEPNTEIRLTFQKDSKGKEYSNLIDYQNIEQIVLSVKKVGSDDAVPALANINVSPDKYTWYMKDYVGKNIASFGYTSLGGDRLDAYGEGVLKLIFITNNGIYVDIDDEDVLQQYVVTGQNIEPNAEIKLTFQKDSKGVEYSNLIDYQSIEQIVLSVKKIGTDDAVPVLTTINASPDKYTWYIRDYVGRNVASCGYTSLGGDRMDSYGSGYVEFIMVTDDGSYVDIDDEDQLKLHVVTGQSVKPNTKMRMTFQKDSKGIEYSNLIDSQTIEEIELYVHKLDSELIEFATAKPEQTADTEEATKAEDTEEVVTSSKAPLDKDTYTSGDFTYIILQDGTIEITGYSGNDRSVSISSDMDGYEITAIGDSVFENCDNMKSIAIWADLTSIGNSAFKGCSNLKDISIPSTTIFIGDHVFEDCSSLKTVIIWGDITSIGDSAFKGCTELHEISVPSSCKIISESAFEGCIDLKSVLLWGGEIIGNSAFRGCTSLVEISIPSEVTSIGESAFEGCIDLESLLLWGGDTIGNSAFRGCTSLVEISIPPEITTIGDYAFEGCTSLKSVIVWGNKTRIGTDAFANCPNLAQIPR